MYPKITILQRARATSSWLDSVSLVTANTYAISYFGVTISFWTEATEPNWKLLDAYFGGNHLISNREVTEPNLDMTSLIATVPRLQSRTNRSRCYECTQACHVLLFGPIRAWLSVCESDQCSRLPFRTTHTHAHAGKRGAAFFLWHQTKECAPTARREGDNPRPRQSLAEWLAVFLAACGGIHGSVRTSSHVM